MPKELTVRLPSHMDNFRAVPAANIPRSTFDRSHSHKTTFDIGYLVPIYVDEALPGDTFKLNMSFIARLATPLKPIMDNMWLETFFFAVPYRLVWDNWEKFCGMQDNPGDSTDFTIPRYASGQTVAWNSLQAYFGLPVGSDAQYASCLWRRAYRFIYNEWFRDENLTNKLLFNTSNGPDSYTGSETPEYRNRKHDYFTSCLPWPQKGDSLEIVSDVRTAGPSAENVGVFNVAEDDYHHLDAGAALVDVSASTTTAETNKLYVAPTINEMRQAFQVQKMLERDARGGTRYVEVIKSHFGVTSPDQRLQRPEYLGGGRTPIVINPVAQTSETNATGTEQGHLAAIGTGIGSGHGFTKSFTEHCLLLGIVNVMAENTYQDGYERMFQRSTRYDFYWPSLAHLGEQAVMTSELWWPAFAASDPVFGYQERFAEYRYKKSYVSGAFNSSHSTPLDMWHLAEDITSLPTLSTGFIQGDYDLDRCVAVPSEPHFLFDSYFKLTCARPMPVYGVPGLIDHF